MTFKGTVCATTDKPTLPGDCEMRPAEKSAWRVSDSPSDPPRPTRREDGVRGLSLRSWGLETGNPPRAPRTTAHQAPTFPKLPLIPTSHLHNLVTFFSSTAPTLSRGCHDSGGRPTFGRGDPRGAGSNSPTPRAAETRRRAAPGGGRAPSPGGRGAGPRETGRPAGPSLLRGWTSD